MWKRLRFRFFSLTALLGVLAGLARHAAAETPVITGDAVRKPETEVYDDPKKKGWYWYDWSPEEKNASDKQKPQVTELAYKKLWNLHPDAFKAHFDRVLKLAVQAPTEKNILQYLEAQDVARRKASAFAAATNFFGQKNPRFSTEDVYPVAAPGQAARTAMQTREYDTVILEARQSFGLILFSRKACGFCDAQRSILDFFESQYAWPIRDVDADANSAMAARFGIEQVPAILLVDKTSGDHMPIASGVISMSNLRKRLYRSIRYLQGKITPEQWTVHEYEKHSGHDPLKFVAPVPPS